MEVKGDNGSLYLQPRRVGSTHLMRFASLHQSYKTNRVASAHRKDIRNMAGIARHTDYFDTSHFSTCFLIISLCLQFMLNLA